MVTVNMSGSKWFTLGGSASTSTSNGSSFHSPIVSSSGNIGIGTINPSSRMTIYSNGSVGFSTNSPNTPLDIYEGDEIKLFDLIVESSNKYKTSGEFAMNLSKLYRYCGGDKEQILKNFETLRDLLSGKVPRSAESEFYNLIENRILKRWTEFYFDHQINIFERIDD